MKIAIVGCGGIGNAHARAYSEIPGVKLAAFVDREAQRAENFQLVYEGGEVYTDIADLPDDIAIASVTTDPTSHFDVAMPLLDRGINVFCEKPLGMTPDEAAALVAESRARDLLLSVGFKMRYEPCFIRARQLLPHIGDLVSISTTKMQPFDPRPSDWRPRVGAMFELSVHDFDLVSFVTGLSPRKVHSALLSRRMGWEREDGFAAIVEYETGVIASLSGSYVAEARWKGRDFCMTVTGEKGYLRVLRGDQIILHAEEYSIEDAAPPGDCFREELEGFVEAVASHGDPPIPACAGFEATSLVDAIWRSGNEARAIDLPEC